MKINVSIGGNLMRRPPGSGGLRETLSEQMRRVLARDLTDELQSIIQSERAADPETRRDALERAVRRIWGATQ
jgi:hypothetical protein